MQFRTIVSGFFLDAATAVTDLANLVHRVGIQEVRPLQQNDRKALGFFEPDREVLGGKWGVFQETWAVLDRVDEIVCLQFYSPYTRFLDARHNENESCKDANTPTSMTYVETFSNTCLSLKPIAALLDTRAHYEDSQWQDREGNRDWVLAQAKLVATGNVNGLADERVSLLYLSEPLMLRWDSDSIRDDREIIELSTGRLVFAGHGPARMA